jgi:hypothetical protein
MKIFLRHCHQLHQYGLRGGAQGVGMLKIRTSKGQNIESFFRMIRTLKNQNVESQGEHQKFEKDQNVKSQIILSTLSFLMP